MKNRISRFFDLDFGDYFAKPAESAPSPIPFGACPTFFQALCHEARQGSTAGYASAGHELRRHIESLAPYEIESVDWIEICGRLDALTAAYDSEGMIDWFEEWLPRCLVLVPVRRRKSFLRGVYRMAAELGVCNEPEN